MGLFTKTKRSIKRRLKKKGSGLTQYFAKPSERRKRRRR